MSENRFYPPDNIDYSSLIPAYQAAFAGEPWYEVSKCVDNSAQKRCADGLSKVAIGTMCTICRKPPKYPAYENDELRNRFEAIAATRPTSWYQEKVGERAALAAIAWRAPVAQVAKEKYSDNPDMNSWLTSTFDGAPITWLDEVFADKSVRASGNLSNFRQMCDGFMDQFETPILAYRTISTAMVNAARRDY